MTQLHNELKSDTFNIIQVSSELKTYCDHFTDDVWRRLLLLIVLHCQGTWFVTKFRKFVVLFTEPKS